MIKRYIRQARMYTIMDRREAELRFWREDPYERPGTRSIQNIVNKAGEARIFLSKLETYASYFKAAPVVLELAGGQLWASTLVKHFHPTARVVGSDLSADAIASRALWRNIYGADVDEAFACSSDAIPLESSSVDLVFTFQAAHHFGRHRSTLLEIARVLKPGGWALYLSEPVCQPWIYKAAHRRVNRKRPVVPEDVLVYRKLEQLGRAAGLSVETRFAPSTVDRQGLASLYYASFSLVPFLQYILPCCADFVITKPA